MKISFCTTSMNRLQHIKQTVEKNIKNASSYENFEFVLLDYNSKDGLGDWVKENLFKYIENEKLKFIQTKEPRYWVAAHAKNIAHKMASGDILCNVDADVSIPEGFCEYINKIFLKPKTIVAFDSLDKNKNNGCAGIIAIKKEDFYSVNGYDENICLGWGCDDMNFQFRTRMHNNLELITPPPICSCLNHSNELRVENCQSKDIFLTRELSVNICQDVALNKDYIANKSIHWGKSNLILNFEKEIKT